MNRIDTTFRKLKTARKKAFIPFITAGFPDLATTEKLILALEASGADIIELGIPFSDPVADGALIQEASQWALERNKVNLAKVLQLVKDVRKITDVPICFMSYYNPIFAFGEEKFLRQAKACGVDGVIIPDLPPEEGQSLARIARISGVEIINFIAPTTKPERIKFISRLSRGFIYYVSLTGTTGTRSSLPADLEFHIKAVKRLCDKPVCVGFGVSNPAQVKLVAKVADGVIVGSAIVRKIKENIGRPDLVKNVSLFVSGLSRNCR
ncbi:MAG: tryptophan synthase subunit alpha [Candidatus Omnitrophica bacterium]|nr:tryptophan synthase subunit alpha [Candidatus Omnitrophota bacterium]